MMEEVTEMVRLHQCSVERHLEGVAANCTMEAADVHGTGGSIVIYLVAGFGVGLEEGDRLTAFEASPKFWVFLQTSCVSSQCHVDKYNMIWAAVTVCEHATRIP
jgi:hypothetical protein